tara:strand:- start:36 stop:638 length:603 start_codon:yes stop_codon:yes gene_type:complete
MSNARNLANLLGTSTTVPNAKMSTGSILGVYHNISNTSLTYSASTSSGHDILDYTLTTKKANSTFYVGWYIAHGVPAEVNNMDSYDMHFLGLRTASSTDTYIGGNGNITRNTANAPTNGKLYTSDVPFAPSRGLTPAYGNAFDLFHRSGSFVDSPSLAAGVTNRYRIRMFNQDTMYINRSRGSSSGSGSVSSMVIMEISA